MLTEREACIWLSWLRTLSSAGRQKLMNVLGSPLQLYQLSDPELLQLVNENLLKEENMEEIRTGRDEEKVREKIREILTLCECVTLADEAYPAQLREIPDPPVALYYRGKLSLVTNGPTLGVVGSRGPSMYGKEMVGRFVPDLIRAGITVISGLAAGIDTEAHMQTLRARDRLIKEEKGDSGSFPWGGTAAVLGGGIDRCYPQQNYNLYAEMCRDQLVLSEYPPGVPPLAIQFPQRNRIISGLSRGLLVIEARKRSGTLITADAALDQGRNVYAVPGRVGDPLSEGTNNLIRQGAMLVQEPEDILEDLGITLPGNTRDGKGGKERRKKAAADLPPKARRIYEKLSYVPVYIDELLDEGECSIPEALQIIVSMERQGLIRQSMQGYYVLSGNR